MKLKHLLSAVAASLLATGSFAQTPTGLNVGAGVVHNFYSIPENPSQALDNACYFGPYLEIGYDLNFTEVHAMYFAARYEFVHCYRGAAGYGPYGIPLLAQAYTYRHYIDIPIKYKFACDISMNAKFFFDIGPTVNFWLANTSYTYEGSPRIYGAQKHNWFNEAPDAYNRVNLSIGTNIGLQFDNAKAFIGYDYGGIVSFSKEMLGRGQLHQLRVGGCYVF